MRKKFGDIQIELYTRKYGKHYKFHPLFWMRRARVNFMKWKLKREMDL